MASDLTYIGKLTLSDLLPGLDEAAASLQSRIDDIDGFLTERQKNVGALQKKVARVQEELQKAQDTAVDAQQILDQANAVLDEASNLVGNLAEALSESGIYYFYYVGRVDEMGSEVAADLSSGLPDKAPTGGDETIAAVILIAGGDGGTTATLTRIGRLVGQIGGNVTEIQNRYSTEAGV